ncbi:phosphotransferase [Terasakiella sp. A23]|uniref:aminoglycoside phosphotransferase family protein n=1 Tax=Terasakiella sp. FCG-A23 TaxID=3080561 RepID=UPI002953891C|nr:phosphotransferase [Terasakiella sp. A23]MDV7337984.1 phosphotransferase [Terasakiella sp. A23]
MTDRKLQREHFLKEQGWDGVDCPLLAGDASFRKYYRLERGGKTVVLMDAPPPEKVKPFIKIAKFLTNNGYSAPKIYGYDVDNGFILLEDLGDNTYTRMLRKGYDERDLYKLAIDVLVDLHEDVKGLPDDLPEYDEELLENEALLLLDWWMKAQFGDHALTKDMRKSYLKAWQKPFRYVQSRPKKVVLRDYHVDNLLLLEDRTGYQACGLLDFQDAVLGSGIYDVVSLLEDARRDINIRLIEEMKMRYTSSFEDLEIDEFEALFAILGAQRHAKVIGIFARLCMRDDKPVYLEHIPRVWRLLERSLKHPILKDVKTWFDTHIPKDARGIPACLQK